MSRRRRWVACVAGIATTAIVAVTVPTPPARAATDPKVLSGEGGSFDEPIINQLLIDAAPALAPLNPNYFDANLDGGRNDFAAGNADFALTELPLSADQAASAARNGRSFAYVPLAASAVAVGVVLVHNGAIPGTPDPVYTGIKLKVVTLAQIFTIVINNWHDPRIQSDNGGVSFDTNAVNIATNFTVDPAIDIYGLITLFLGDAAAKPVYDKYAVAERQPPDTPLERYPSNNGTSGGEKQVADLLVPVDPQTGKVHANPSSWGDGHIAPIGVDWTGAPRNIPAVAVQNAAGSFVAPTPAAIAAALGDATMDGATNLVTFNANPNDGAAYAIPVMSYLAVPTTGLDPAKAKALAAFIRFAYSDPGAKDIESLGGVRVTDQMKAAGLKVATQVESQGPPPSSTTTTSSSTTSTTASAAAHQTRTGVASASGSAQTPTGGTLPNTGKDSQPEVLAGAVLLVAGETVRRWLRSRSR